MAEDFNAEQKRYLEGFASGIAAARLTGGCSPSGQGAPGAAGRAHGPGCDPTSRRRRPP